MQQAISNPPATQQAGAGRISRSQVVVLAVAGAFLIGLTAIALLGGSRGAAPAAGQVPVNPAIEAKWGVRVTRVAVTADGGIVDMRFIVLDPDKALAMMQDLKNLPILYPEGSGAVIGSVSQMSARHDLNPGQTYFLLYRNTGGSLVPGHLVTIAFGDLELRHVVSQ